MKKLLMIFSFLMGSTRVGYAQGKGNEQLALDNKYFISFSTGPSFPIGQFASNDINNKEAGFAKPGYTLNLDFTYKINPSVILDINILYARFDLSNMVLQQAGLSSDHWQYYGLLVGPRYDMRLGNKSLLSIKGLLGITNVNSPAFHYDSTLVIQEGWAAAFAMQFGTDYRYGISKNFFLIADLDYTYMFPTLQVSSTDGTGPATVKQNIAAFSLTVGIGINFQ